jgi:hemerythrin-like domain-containing protein
MKATEILVEEHEVIWRVLDALETSAQKLRQGEEIRPGFFLEAADFIKNFADGCHHKKEEGVLFIAMAEAGVPVQGGPIGVMLTEHEQGRLFTRQMYEAAQQWQAGEMSAKDKVVQNALDYVNLLRQHIQKENHILFPMANATIPAERQEKIEQDFEHVEHEETGAGVHEKYLALAEALEKESTGAR